MAKFGIISDTHIENLTDRKINSVLKELVSIFSDVDLIIHAGDICSEEILETLKNIAPIKYVAGEWDSDSNIERFLLISIEDFSKPIGVIHIPPEDLEEFCQQKGLIGGILINGHTHIPLIKATKFNVLVLNPGSPTKPKVPKEIEGFDKPIARPSVMKLIIENEIVTSFIINLKCEL